MRQALAAVLCWAVVAAAQQVGENASARQPDTLTLKTGTQLVVETVVVTDKKGKPVTGLKAEDFAITEDGAPQTVRIFDYHELAKEVAEEAPAPVGDIHIYDKLGRASITPETPGDTRYKDRRLLALYFDMTAMSEGEQLRALAAADKFVRSQMTASDLVAILRYAGGSVDVLQEFTADRGRLLSIIQTMIVGEGQGFGEANDSGGADTGAAFGQDDSEFNIFNSDRQLAALQTAAQMMAQLSEKKSLIYFASGLQLNGMNNQAQLGATVNAAIRAGVSFWPIDARGLVALPPMGDATTGSPGGTSMYSGTGAVATSMSLQQSQDTLYALAGDTGGKALLDSNDLEQGIVRAQQAVPSYYVLGYYTSNTSQDGKFRRIRISLPREQAANLDYRQGYFASKQFSKFTAADKERQLEDALMLADPITELTVAMEIDYFQLNRAEYFVPVVVKIPGRELALAKKGGAERTVIDFIGEVKDAYGTTMTNVRDSVTAKLTEATAAELAKRPIVYDTGFTLLPGKYSIKFLARDNETGRIGTYQADFVVPNLNQEEKRVPISSVVLSSQRADLKEALYNAIKEKDRSRIDSVNPLVRDHGKLIPSVTRVFRQSQVMQVFLQAYARQAGASRPVVAFASLYRGGEKAFESEPIVAAQGAGNRLDTRSLAFEIPLGKLVPGRYECQVSVLDSAGQKATFWRAPIVVIP